MKNVLQLFAILLHPALIPFYSAIAYTPLFIKYGWPPVLLFAIWILFLHLILPVVYFTKVKQIKLSAPNLAEREAIFKTYLGLTLLIVVVTAFMFKEYLGFSLALFILYALLWFWSAIKFKASWHAAAWAMLLVSALALILKFGFVDNTNTLITLVLLTVLVTTVRYLQKAHTLNELLMGLATGAASATIVIFI
mgnify:CR=1 FL=1